jgi:hypothetical protein
MLKSETKSNTPKAVQDCHNILLWLTPHLDKFPKQRRFTLGKKIETTLLDVLELLITASYSHKKHSELREANIKVELLRHLWRVAFELQSINSKSWQHGVELLLDLGRQIGGWLRSVKQ